MDGLSQLSPSSSPASPQPPDDLLELFELPPGFQALVVRHLGAEGILALFRVSHTTRRLVLTHSHSVSLSPAPGARLHVVARLIEIPPDQPCFPALRLRTKEAAQLPLLAQIQVLRAGRVQELKLQGSFIVAKALAAGVAAACSGLQKLTLRNLSVADGALFTLLALACTRLTQLTLDGVELLHPDAEESLGQLATGLPVMQQLEVSRVQAAPFSRHPQLLQRITSINRGHGSGWPELLQQHARSLQRLHTVISAPHYRWQFATFRAALNCPSLTHLDVADVMPPIGHRSGSSRDSRGSGEMAMAPAPRSAALQQLHLTLSGHIQTSNLIKFPWLKMVSQLTLSRLDLPDAVSFSSEQQKRALTQQLRQAAELLAAVPNLVLCVDPSIRNNSPWSSILQLSSWPRDEALAVSYMGALEPLAPRLGAVSFLAVFVTPSLIAEMGRIVGGTLHTMCLISNGPLITVALWRLALHALPVLAVIYCPDAYEEQELRYLAGACASEQRRIELRVPQKSMPKEQAAALVTSWVRVVFV